MNQDQKERNRAVSAEQADVEWKHDAAFDRRVWLYEQNRDRTGVTVIDSAAELPGGQRFSVGGAS